MLQCFFLGYALSLDNFCVTILTYNAEKTLEACLESVKTFSEVIILDTGSTDKSLDIAKRFSQVKIFSSPFIGFGPLHNLAISYTSSDWILSLDSDEVLSKEALLEIQSLSLDRKTVYAFPLKNYFHNKWIFFCGWYPDYKFRLFHRKETCFSPDFVHESVITKGKKTVYLKFCIFHYSYQTISDFLIKMERYSELFAKQYAGKKRGGVFKAIVKSWFSFFRNYILKKGFLGGKEGYMIARYLSDVTYYKYIKLEEKRGNK